MRDSAFIFIIYFWMIPLWAMPSDTDESSSTTPLITEKPNDECILDYLNNAQNNIMQNIQRPILLYLQQLMLIDLLQIPDKKKELLNFLSTLSNQSLRALYRVLHDANEAIKTNNPMKATNLVYFIPRSMHQNPILNRRIQTFVAQCEYQQSIIQSLSLQQEAPPTITNTMDRQAIEPHPSICQNCNQCCDECLQCFKEYPEMMFRCIGLVTMISSPICAILGVPIQACCIPSFCCLVLGFIWNKDDN